MARDMDTAVIYGLSLADDQNHMYFVPVMENDDLSHKLAFEWGSTLARLSHQNVIVYRNGIVLITMPAQ